MIAIIVKIIKLNFGVGTKINHIIKCLLVYCFFFFIIFTTFYLKHFGCFLFYSNLLFEIWCDGFLFVFRWTKRQIRNLHKTHWFVFGWKKERVSKQNKPNRWQRNRRRRWRLLLANSNQTFIIWWSKWVSISNIRNLCGDFNDFFWVFHLISISKFQSSFLRFINSKLFYLLSINWFNILKWIDR